MKITKTLIDAMKFEGPRPAYKDVRPDDELAGFGVRVWPSGAKTFVFEYRFQGRMRYLTIGKYGALTLHQARDLARLASAQVLQGADPQAEKVRIRQGETVADLGRIYIERHARAHNKSWKKDKERLDGFILPAFGTTKVASLTRHDVARLHQKIGAASPTTANRVLSLLSSMFNRARLDFGFLPQAHPNPTEGIKRFAEEKRDRFVTKDEMPKLAAAIDAESNLYVKALIWLYLFTGLRKSELQTMTWSDIDLNTSRIRLADTKGGRPHYLPVSTPALELFKAIPRQLGNPHIFCGREEGAHIVNFHKPWTRIRGRAGLMDVRLHDLRRTVGSWMAEQGLSLPLIGRVLNHAHPSTTSIYARFQLSTVASALEDTSRLLTEAAKGDHKNPSGVAGDAASAAGSSTTSSAVDE